VTDQLPHRRGPLFWVSAVAGWALIGWGVRGLLHFHVDSRPAELVRFFLGGALIHDLVFAPLVLGGGVVIARLSPSRWRAYVQGTLLVIGAVALFAYPEVRDYARILHNPTSLPHNYTANLAVVAGVICVLAVAVGLVRSWRRARG
jgi:hypothetical protein